MARHRTATNILELRGAFKNHPERKKDRAKEPKPKVPMPDEPPKHLTGPQKAIWKEILDMAIPGVIFHCDSLTVEMATKLVERFREEGADMPSGHLARLSVELGKLGLSPSDRAKLQAE